MIFMIFIIVFEKFHIYFHLNVTMLCFDPPPSNFLLLYIHCTYCTYIVHLFIDKIKVSV
jgi:hypothetical protein